MSNTLKSALGSAHALKRKLNYRKFVHEKLTVLMPSGKYPLKDECAAALTLLGHRVCYADLGDTLNEVMKPLLMALIQYRPDFFLSINHRSFDDAGQIGMLLEELSIPVAVWYIDSPFFTLTESAFPAPEMSTLFLWDRALIQRSKHEFGLNDVHFLPLATDTAVFQPCGAANIPATTFVGDSMEYALKKWRSMLPERLWKRAKSISKSLAKTSRAETLEFLSPERVAAGDLDLKWKTLTAATWIATANFRHTLLKGVVNAGLTIYGDPGWRKLLPTCDFRGPVAYGRDLARVFETHDIILNATSLQMPTAVNQRVFDVPASGGFLLTDDQADLYRFFDAKQDFVSYKDPQELPALIDFYRRHPEKRAKISGHAHERILKDHRYIFRLRTLVTTLRKKHALASVHSATGSIR